MRLLIGLIFLPLLSCSPLVTIWTNGLSDQDLMNAEFYPPALDPNGFMYLWSSSGVLTSLKIKSGRNHWSRNFSRRPCEKHFSTCMPIIDKKSIYFVDMTGTLQARSKASGKLQWEIPLDHQHSSMTLSSEQTLYVTSIKNKIYSIDKRSQAISWSKKILESWKYDSVQCSAATKALLICAAVNGYLFALDRSNAKLKWRVKLTKNDTTEIVTEPIIINTEKIFTITSDGVAHFVDAFSGEQVNTLSLKNNRRSIRPVFQKPAFTNDTIFFIFSSTLYAYDYLNKEFRWQSATEMHPVAPALSGDLIITGSPKNSGSVSAYERKTGRKRWSADFPDLGLWIKSNGKQLLLSRGAKGIVSVNVRH